MKKLKEKAPAEAISNERLNFIALSKKKRKTTLLRSESDYNDEIKEAGAESDSVIFSEDFVNENDLNSNLTESFSSVNLSHQSEKAQVRKLEVEQKRQRIREDEIR